MTQRRRHLAGTCSLLALAYWWGYSNGKMDAEIRAWRRELNMVRASVARWERDT